MIIYWLTRFFFIIFAKIFFRLKVEGLENLPQKQGGFIVAANHASSLDPFVVSAALPCYIRWTVIYEYYDQWLFRGMLKQMRFIRLQNNLPKEAFRALLQGEVLGFFPEGRRTWDGELGQAMQGVAALARRTSHPVVPVAILGTYQALPRMNRALKFHPITVRLGQPLIFLTGADQENSEKMMQAIKALMEKPC